MKMYKKSKLSYENGYIVKEGKIICISNLIVAMFNTVEADYQRAMWNKAHKVIALVPQQEEFEFESEFEIDIPHIEVATPHLDEASETAIAMMDELDAVAAADEVNEYLEKIKPLFEFVSNDKVVSPDIPGFGGKQARFNLKNIGNPLELDSDKLLDIVKAMFE